MDPIFDRLGRLIRSWSTPETATRSTPDQAEADALDELERFLRGERPRPRPEPSREQTYNEPPPPPMSPQVRGAWATLGLKPGTAWALVQKQHHALLKTWHPDKFGHDASQSAAATQKTQAINEAFQILKRDRGL